MKENNFFLKCSILFAISFWLFESIIHFFVYNEFKFEVIPSDIDEIWMRCFIFTLLVSFGVFADYHTRKIAKKDNEKYEVYSTMLNATQHILSNFLQSMVLFKGEAEKSKDIQQHTIDTYEKAIQSSIKQINNLKNIDRPDKESIENRFLPK